VNGKLPCGEVGCPLNRRAAAKISRWRKALVGIYGVACLVFFLLPHGGVNAKVSPPETFNQSQQMDDQRLGVLEAVGSEHRLSVLEAEVASLGWELRSMLVGMALLLVEAGFRVGKRAA
jgi:hypothetical protein